MDLDVTGWEGQRLGVGAAEGLLVLLQLLRGGGAGGHRQRYSGRGETADVGQILRQEVSGPGLVTLLYRPGASTLVFRKAVSEVVSAAGC